MQKEEIRVKQKQKLRKQFIANKSLRPLPLTVQIFTKMWIRCHFPSNIHSVMTSLWQRQKNTYFFSVRLLSCISEAITAEVGRSKTVILNFFKDPEGYGTK